MTAKVTISISLAVVDNVIVLAEETLVDVVSPTHAPVGLKTIFVPIPVNAVVFAVPVAFCVNKIVKVVIEFFVAGKFLNETIPTTPFVRL